MFTHYLMVTTAVLGVLLLLTLWNVYLFRKRTVGRIPDGELPMISVLVPARNEENTIERCISSLLSQEYPKFEIIVLDDNSTDATGSILDRLEKSEQRLRIVHGRALPRGWVGKCYACHQLAEQARGSWLLFTDADTVHEPSMLRDALELAVSRQADLLTLIPLQTMETFAEKLILPLLHFSAFAMLPFYAVERVRNSKFSIGIGQFMFFRSAAYAAVGGHEAVKNNLVEDVWLARKIKEHGLHLVAADGRPMVSCRMYTRWTEVWNGFSKNIFAGFNFSLPAMAAVMTMYAALFVAPFIVFASGIVRGDLTALQASLLASQVVMNYAMRIVLSVKFRLGILSTILHPFGVLGVIAIAVNSWRWIAHGSGARWKDRIYAHHPASAPATEQE